MILSQKVVLALCGRGGYDAAMLVLKEAVNDKYDYISWWLYEGEPDYKVWSSDNTEEWNLTEPEALYDFIVNECQE